VTSVPRDQEKIDPTYELLKCLGSGGMATVYKGRDLRLNRFVAIKVIHTELNEQGDFRARFLREARALALCTHPNVIQVHFCSDASASTLYLVTEYVEGRSLSEWLSLFGPFPWEIALAIVERILSGLNTVHSRGILHRDIKPPNILLSSEGVPKLADFGLAKGEGLSNVTSENLPLGTLRYLAPEAFEGRPATIAQDLYATGLVLYELVVGRPAFVQESVGELMSRIRSGNWPRLEEFFPEIWPELVPLVEKALAVAPNERFSSAEQMRLGCRTVLESVGILDPAFLLNEFAIAQDRGLWLDKHRERLCEHMGKRAQFARLEGRQIEAIELLDRMVLLDPDVGPGKETSRLPPTTPPETGESISQLIGADSVGCPVGSLPFERTPPQRTEDRLEQKNTPRVSDSGLARLAARAYVLLSFLVCPLLVLGERVLHSMFLVVPLLLSIFVVGEALRWQSSERRWRAALGSLFGMVALVAFFPGETLTPVLHAYQTDVLDRIDPLSLVCVAWFCVLSWSLVLLFARYGLSWSAYLSFPPWFSLALVLTSGLGLSAHLSVVRENRNLTRVLDLPVAVNPGALTLGIQTGFSLPRSNERLVGRPPGVPGQLLRHYSSLAPSIIVAINATENDLARWLEGPEPSVTSVSVAVSGSSPANLLSDNRFWTPADEELFDALRPSQDNLLLITDPEQKTSSGRLTRRQFFEAHTRFMASVASLTGASAVEIPSTAHLGSSQEARASDWDSEERELLEREARTLRRLLPRVKIGIRQTVTAAGPQETTDVRTFTRLAASDWIDWVGAAAYGESLPARELDLVVQALQSSGHLSKLWLFTGVPSCLFARPPWRESEDSAWIAIPGRYARSRGLSTWIHCPGSTFVGYGWWYSGHAALRTSATTPLRSFLTFGR